MPFAEADLKAAATDFVQLNVPAGVSWKRSYCDFDEKKFFCEWEGPDKATVEQTFKMIDMPFDAVYPVKIFDVATREFEA